MIHKNNILFCFILAVLFCPLWRISLVAQDSSQTAPEFPIGAFVSENESTYGKVDSSGINYMVAGFTDYTYNSPIKLMGSRSFHPTDYLTKYAQGYYTRWEAEKYEVALLETGIKHPVENG